MSKCNRSAHRQTIKEDVDGDLDTHYNAVGGDVCGTLNGHYNTIKGDVAEGVKGNYNVIGGDVIGNVDGHHNKIKGDLIGSDNGEGNEINGDIIQQFHTKKKRRISVKSDDDDNDDDGIIINNVAGAIGKCGSVTFYPPHPSSSSSVGTISMDNGKYTIGNIHGIHGVTSVGKGCTSVNTFTGANSFSNMSMGKNIVINGTKLSCPFNKNVYVKNGDDITTTSGLVTVNDELQYKTPVKLSQILSGAVGPDIASSVQDVTPITLSSSSIPTPRTPPTRQTNHMPPIARHMPPILSSYPISSNPNPSPNPNPKPKTTIPVYDKNTDDSPSTSENDSCIICMDNKRHCALIPCGHSKTCLRCITELYTKKSQNVDHILCPECKEIVVHVHRIFM
jgi:Zinc finger, C3HC4 type (RING finger)